ncbi:GPI mannosyltransferase 2 [Cryptosporidium felis]|nr:GPI mannosyltransferase 2 [Cryptosporidium felis]
MKINVRRVILLATFSRLACILISYLTNDLFSNVRNTGIIHLYIDNNSYLQETFYWKLFKSFINWDGEYYLRISYYNDYEYEHQHAFLPLYPLMVGWISRLIMGLNKMNILVNIVAGTLLSNIAFVVASVGLYLFHCELYNKIELRNIVFPGLSTLFFIFPSSNIFNSSMYTESLYSCFNFWAAFMILRAESNSHKHGFFSSKNLIFLVPALLCMSMTCGIRSNGILNSIPLFFYFVSTTPSPKRFILFVIHWLIAFVSFISVVSPFISYLIYSYYRYCVKNPMSRPWCHSLIPNIYSFVQNEYWDNGIFNYWRIEKLDKFLLVVPFIVVSMYSTRIFFPNEFDRKNQNFLTNFKKSLSVLGYIFQVYFLLVSITLYGFIQAAQTKVKHEELKKKQERTLGWCLPGFEETRTRGSELSNRANKLEDMYILARKSFNSYNPIVEKQNSGIISRRNHQERLEDERREEEIIQKMFKKH